MNGNSHSTIREDMRKRIVAGEWQLGEQMPNEVEFAEEYGCARTTVNRALRTLAEEGLIERKRKGGTRVRPMPTRQAQLTIPIMREQVEASGRSYSHKIMAREVREAPEDVVARMRLDRPSALAWLETLHMGDDRAFALERRWIKLEAVPEFVHADLTELSANEWLVRTVPFSNGEVALCATSADADQAKLLGIDKGAPLFTLRRTTWLDQKPVTTMMLYYPPDYRLAFTI